MHSPPRLMGNARSPFRTKFDRYPLVIAHRGASGYRPEHTLAAYQLAIFQGADFIEPDLVATKDGILVARHENEISSTTDVADRPEFRERQCCKTIDGRKVSGWFTEDFTLAELKTLRTKERMPNIRPENAKFNGIWEIPTLREIIDLLEQVEKETGRRIGIYPETKHPSYFDRPTFLDGSTRSLSLEEMLIDTLIAENFTESDRVFIQSFEVTNLKHDLTDLMSKAGIDLPLIQLLDECGAPSDSIDNGDSSADRHPISPARLAEIATYATGIGPSKRLLLPVDGNNDLLPPTSLVEDARAAGLSVHVWTVRDENIFLANDYRNDPEAEYRHLLELGVDGYFSDFPDTAVKIRNQAIKSFR